MNLSSRPSINSLTEQVNRINQLSVLIGKQEPVFRERTMASMNYSCYEAGFLKSISWLYALYQEAGDQNIDFLVEKLQTYSSQDVPFCKEHLRTVYCLRTTLQHSLDLTSKRNSDIKDYSDQWFMSVIKKCEPFNSNTWRLSLYKLFKEARKFLDNLQNTLEKIGEDEFCSEIILEWNVKSRRYHSPHEFDPIIFNTAKDLGIDSIDPVKIRNKHYDRWKKQLELLNGDYNFETEARKLIETSLLELFTAKLPITGKDIIEHLGIPPGPIVKQLLGLAQAICQNEKCTKDKLLLKLRDQLDSISSTIDGL